MQKVGTPARRMAGTRHSDGPGGEIADLYSHRWEIELGY